MQSHSIKRCCTSVFRIVTTGFVVVVIVTLFLCPGSTFAATKKKHRIRPPSSSSSSAAMLPEEDEPLIDQIAMETVDTHSHAIPNVANAPPPRPDIGYTGFKINPNCKCGRSPYPKPDGNPHPWTAAIFYKNKNSPSSLDASKPTMLLFCTGSLINSLYVITASRCVQGLNSTDLQVWLSEKPIWSDQEQQEQSHLKKSSVEKIIIHPDFDPSVLNHEVALLRLSDPVKLSRKRRDNMGSGKSSSGHGKRSKFFSTPVCLPKYDVMMDESDYRGEASDDDNGDEVPVTQKKGNPKDYNKRLQGTVVSWDKKGRTSYSLVQTHVPIVNGIRKCEEMTNNTVVVNENMLCAGNMEQGAQESCSMDTGSPLVIYEKGGPIPNENSPYQERIRLSSEDSRGHFTLVGISSWLYGCTNLANVNILYDVIFPNNTAKPQVPGIYASVPKYRDWITHNTLDAVWCA